MSEPKQKHVFETCRIQSTPIALCLLFGLSMSTAYASQAQVDLYFPYAMLGGSDSNRWTAEVVVLASGFTDASVSLEFISETGSKHPNIIFVPSKQSGSGSMIPPGETRRFVATGYDSLRPLKGWIRGKSTVPVVPTLILKLTTNGSPYQSFRIPAIRPAGGSIYQLIDPTKVFLLNRDDTAPLELKIEVTATNGQTIESRTVLLPPNTARDFVFDGTRTGTLDLTPSPASRLYTFVAGAVPFIHSGTSFAVAMSDGGYRRSIAHKEQLNYQFRVIETTAKFIASLVSESFREEGNIYNANRYRHVFDGVHLEIPEDAMVNAYARNASVVGVSLGLVELLADSPGELAFVIGHEFGHIFQQRTNELSNNPYNIEADADSWGALFSLMSGHDVYASAGALSKLAMVTGNSSLATQMFEDMPYFEAHRSINTRMSTVFDMLVALCSNPNWVQSCADYKRVVHPNLPSIAPLDDEINGASGE